MKKELVARFLATVNALAHTELEPFLAEWVFMHIETQVFSGRREVVNYFKLWLQTLINLQCHCTEMTENEHSVFVDVAVLPNPGEHYNAIWCFHIHNGVIDRIKIFTDGESK